MVPANTVTSNLPQLTVLGAVNIKFGISHGRRNAGLQRRWQTCRLCSSTGFANFQKQNRELQYASSAGASRKKELFESCYIDKRKLSCYYKVACRASAGLRGLIITGFVKSQVATNHIIKVSRFNRKQAGASGLTIGIRK